jgi:protein CrcB
VDGHALRHELSLWDAGHQPLREFSPGLFCHPRRRALRPPPQWRLFFAIGFLGAYTTFSTFSYESLALLQEGLVLLGLANMLGSVVLGQVAVVTGMVLARLL